MNARDYLMFALGIAFALLMVVASNYRRASADCVRDWVGINTISRHIQPSRKYNEENWGVFYECRRDQDWSYQLGYYENSFNRTTAYGLVMYQPWVFLGARLGGFAGGGTGYREKEVDGKDVPTGGLSPLAGGILSYERKNVGLNLIVATSVVGLQLKVSF